jgi:hypothetical protein
MSELMLANIVFCGVFLSQILLVSYYFPKRLLSRMRHVITTYPPAQYPKLYPQPIECYQKMHTGYAKSNQLIMLLGLLVLGVVEFFNFAQPGQIGEGIPLIYGALQFLPLLRLELSEMGQFKLMREANNTSTRQADLSPRRLLDYISPGMLLTALVLLLISVFLDFYWHDFVFSLSHDSVQRSITLIVTHLFMAGLVAKNLYGKKLNPHQSSKDRHKNNTLTVKSMVYCSIAMSLLFTSMSASNVFDISAFKAILMSLYFQGIVVISVGTMLRSAAIEDMDLEVYK